MTKVFDELVAPSFDRAKGLVGAVRALLDLEVTPAAPSGVSVSKLPFKVMSLRATLLYRVVDLAESSLSLLPDRATGAAILARAVMETVALFFALRTLVAAVVEPRQLNNFDEKIMQMTFGSRAGHTSEQALNILTIIKHMDKAFKGMAHWHAQLSEFAHPNYAGVLGSYGAVRKGTLVLSLEKRRTQPLGRVVVVTLCTCLEVARNLHWHIDEDLETFRSICQGNSDAESNG